MAKIKITAILINIWNHNSSHTLKKKEEMALIFLIQWVSWTLIIIEMNNEINVTWTKPVTINAKEGNQA